jgi:hypothetical protein
MLRPARLADAGAPILGRIALALQFGIERALSGLGPVPERGWDDAQIGHLDDTPFGRRVQA